ncbi:RnfH family protein [uncultured Pseudomonas sp.]|uniref:RnfH family protein n=1 Tax=uncultured Pseudomonas sp. TaxID=114707 RepID=UPI0025F62CA3|nr:RnfH family protein [uncultured Pseudomonas sp.]
MPEPLIDIEVVHAGVDRQVLLTLQVPAGSTLMQAVLASGIAQSFPELDLQASAMGIFGKVVKDPAAHVLEAGDRIEIYRPLLADPKEVRRLRAAKTAKPRKGRA